LKSRRVAGSCFHRKGQCPGHPGAVNLECPVAISVLFHCAGHRQSHLGGLPPGILENCSGQKDVLAQQYTMQLTRQVAAGADENESTRQSLLVWVHSEPQGRQLCLEVVHPWE